VEKVTSRKQAIAIGLSSQVGLKYQRKPAAGKKSPTVND
jgi:hypothetical protein